MPRALLVRLRHQDTSSSSNVSLCRNQASRSHPGVTAVYIPTDAAFLPDEIEGVCFAVCGAFGCNAAMLQDGHCCALVAAM